MEQDQPVAAGQSGRANSASDAGRPAAVQGGVPAPADAVGKVGPHGAAETVLWSGRTCWRHYAGRIALWVLGNLLVSILVGVLASRVDWLDWGGAAWVVSGMVLISGVLVLGRVAIRVLGTYFRLTSQRLFIERGILSRTIDQTELIRVDDVRMHQSLFDRMFGIGNVTLLTTDATDRSVLIEGIRDPSQVAEIVRQQMRALRGKSLFVETL